MSASHRSPGDPQAARSQLRARPATGADHHQRTETAPANGQEPGVFGESLVVDIDVLDRILRSVFAASLPLVSARSMTDGTIATRLADSIDELDDLVHSIHHTALAAHTEDPVDLEPVHRVPAHTGVERGGSHLVDEAARAIEQLDAVLGALWVDAIASTDGGPSPRDRICDAARLVRLAKLTLTATALR